MANPTYRRQARPRSSRSQPQSDAVVIALTAQVIVCVVLLLAAVIAKKADENRYNTVREQYDVMISDPQGAAEAIDGLVASGGLQQLFASIENALTSLIERFAGTPAEQEEPRYELYDPDTDIDEPAAGTDSQPGQGLPELDYNYLGGPQTALATLGQGGEFPVTVSGADTSSLPAPEGTTFAPVTLSRAIRPPVTGIITSEFSYRDHPVSGKSDFHNGIDIAAAEGKEILAALDGTVKECGWDEIYGNYVLLTHASNLQTFYAHCSELLVAQGQVVKQGEGIAQVGHTGVATGSHLHFSVIVEGQYTDPYWVLRNNIKLVDGVA